MGKISKQWDDAMDKACEFFFMKFFLPLFLAIVSFWMGVALGAGAYFLLKWLNIPNSAWLVIFAACYIAFILYVGFDNIRKDSRKWRVIQGGGQGKKHRENSW